MESNQGDSLPWNLGWLRGLSILILNCDDQGTFLPQSEWKVTKGLLYLGTNGEWDAILSQSWIAGTKGLLYLEIWADWEASLSQS